MKSPQQRCQGIRIIPILHEKLIIRDVKHLPQGYTAGEVGLEPGSASLPG